MTMLKCVWSIEAHIPHTHFWRPPWGSKKSSFLASCCIFKFFLVRCPYSPYDLVRILCEIVYFRATPQNLRAKILCGPREKIPLRANRRQNLLSSRRPCVISRETVWTSRDLEIVFARDCRTSRDLENVFARNCITSRDLKSFFAQTVEISPEILRQQLFFFFLLHRFCVLSDFWC